MPYVLPCGWLDSPTMIVRQHGVIVVNDLVQRTSVSLGRLLDSCRVHWVRRSTVNFAAEYNHVEAAVDVLRNTVMSLQKSTVCTVWHQISFWSEFYAVRVTCLTELPAANSACAERRRSLLRVAELDTQVRTQTHMCRATHARVQHTQRCWQPSAKVLTVCVIDSLVYCTVNRPETESGHSGLTVHKYK